MEEIYLDNSATTRVCEKSAEKVLELMTQCYGNPSSLHKKGLEAQREVAHAKMCIRDRKTNVLLEGRTNLLYLPEYEVDSVKRLLHFLEQRGELAKLIGAQKEKLGVLIGGESNQPEMIDTSVVLVRYSMGRQTRGTPVSYTHLDVYKRQLSTTGLSKTQGCP